METITVEILKHIRKVQLSNSQRPVYFEWNGLTIKGKGAKISKKFFSNKNYDEKRITLTDLKDNFVLIAYKNNEIVAALDKNYILPDAATLFESKIKYKLAKIVNKQDVFNPTKHIGITALKSATNYELIIANPTKVGKPRIYLIKGQDFYNSKIKEFQRGFVMDKIKENFLPFIENVPVITEYPIRIECHVYDTVKNYYDNTNSNEGLGSAWDIDNYAYPYMKAFPDLLQKHGKIKNDDRLCITQPPSPIFVPIDNHEDRKLVFIITKDEREVITSNKIYQDFHKALNSDLSLLNNEILKTNNNADF